MHDAGANGQPQGTPTGAAPGHPGDPTEPGDASAVRLGIPSGSEVPPGTGKDPPRARTLWRSRRWLLGVAGAVTIFFIGAGILYWGTNSGFARTDNVQTNGDLLPISPHVGGTVVKVLVDARIGTVLIDLRTVSPDTSHTLFSAVQQRNARQRDHVRALSWAWGTCSR